MWLRKASLALTLATITTAAGCVVTVDFDPVGTDASVQNSWLVNGATPTAASCAEVGATNVRVRFYDGARTVDHPGLVFDCEDGGFDTRPNAVLADGVWRMQLLAINASGTVIAEGPIASYDTLVFGGHIVMDQVDFTASAGANIAASWTIDGATANATNCSAAGIDQVGLEFLDGAGLPIAEDTVLIDCSAGSVLTQVAPGDYSVRVLALDATNAVITMGTNEIFSLSAGATHTLNAGAPIDFVTQGFNPRGTDATLGSLWAIGGVDGSPDACKAVDAVSVDVLFAPSDDTDFSEEVVVQMGAPCDPGAFDSATPIVAAGAYLIAVELKDDTGAVISRVETATPVTVTTDPVEVDIDFRLAHSTLHFFLAYADGAGAFTDCSTGAVATIDWGVFFELEDTPMLESGGPMACEESVHVSGTTGNELTAGAYALELIAETADMSKSWGIRCDATVDGPGGLGIAVCNVPRN